MTDHTYVANLRDTTLAACGETPAPKTAPKGAFITRRRNCACRKP